MVIFYMIWTKVTKIFQVWPEFPYTQSFVDNVDNVDYFFRKKMKQPSTVGIFTKTFAHK